METLRIEPTESKDSGPCSCCGNNSRCVWGFAHSAEATIATYFVHWTLTRVADHGANFDLIFGKRGEQASKADRCLVSLAYRLFKGTPQFMVIDGAGRPASELVGLALQRSDVLGRPTAEQAFAVADAILEQDPRIAELLGQQ